MGMRDNGWSPLFVASWAGKTAVAAELLKGQAADTTAATTSEHLGILAGLTALSVAELWWRRFFRSKGWEPRWVLSGRS